MKRMLLPGATLGVMGGGQLGRMFVHAAQSLGYQTAVLDPDPASPAGQVAHWHIKADYLDEPALAQLLQRCDAITTEFENVPSAALWTLGAHRVVAPDAQAVGICQDRAKEKAAFARAGVPCAPHAVIESAADLAGVPADLFPGILKTARLGYDGKGQRPVTEPAGLAAAFGELGQVRCVLERRLDLAMELSVVLACGADGSIVHLPVQQNLHRDGILAVTQVPAPDLPEALAAQAVAASRALAETLRYVGVLCVEFFVTTDGRLLANEMAPRPHNSGHYSLDACDCSQFELQVRALAGLPLRTPRLHSPAVMLNLLGDLWPGLGTARVQQPPWDQVLAIPGTHLHLYGKLTPRAGRKMGHLTVTGPDPATAQSRARQAAGLLGLPAF